MNEFDEIYTDLIMEHSMASPYKKELESYTCSSLGHNPNCGDEIKLEAIVENGKIIDMAFSGHGCAISQSSTSIMIELLKGKDITEAKKLISIFMKMIKREEISKEEFDLLKNARAFENISNMPARVKCALLSWHTLEDLLNQLEEKSE
jgi:nitrogen fixation NifU-like protein